MKKLMLIFALLSNMAHAEFLTGNDLHSALKSTDKHNRDVAMGYIAGVHDTGRTVIHCSPNTVTATQVTDMVAAFLQANPISRDKSGDSIVSIVLMSAWPCPKKQSI